MPLVPNFTSTESLSSPGTITFTDTSTGSDNTLTVRTITLTYADGTVGSPIGWNIGQASITIANLVPRSTTASVTVNWLDGATVVYTKTILMEWDLFDYVFMFGLIQTQTSTGGSILQDQNYLFNSMNYIVNLTNSETACNLIDDAYSSQSALDRNYALSQNQSKYF